MAAAAILDFIFVQHYGIIKLCFWGVLTPKLYFYHRDFQKALPCAETRVLSPHWSWSVLRCDLDPTRRVQKKKEQKIKPKFAIFADPLPVVSHQPNFACRVVSRISFLVLSFKKIGWKMWEQWGSNLWLSHWLGRSLIQQLVAIAQAVMSLTPLLKQD